MVESIRSVLGERTKLVRANTNSPSLRTTVPESIVRELKLKGGDSIEWEHVICDGKLVINVKKAGKD